VLMLMLIFLLYPLPPSKQFLRGAVICNKTSTHWNRSVFSACLKQSDVFALDAHVVTVVTRYRQLVPKLRASHSKSTLKTGMSPGNYEIPAELLWTESTIKICSCLEYEVMLSACRSVGPWTLNLLNTLSLVAKGLNSWICEIRICKKH